MFDRVAVKKIEGEWVAVYYRNGKKDEGKTYYADSKADAEATARAMMESASKASKKSTKGLGEGVASGGGGLLVALFVAAAGGAGYYFWQKKKAKSKSFQPSDLVIDYRPKIEVTKKPVEVVVVAQPAPIATQPSPAAITVPVADYVPTSEPYTDASPWANQPVSPLIRTVVGKGETLNSIAKRFYSDGALWALIWDANRSVIGANPDKLVVGSSLTIPQQSSFTREIGNSAHARAAAYTKSWPKMNAVTAAPTRIG